MQNMLTALPVTLRRLLRQPGLSATIVAVVALGIGANAAIFGVLSGILLRGLPVERPHELRVVNWAGRQHSLSNFEAAGSARYGKDGTMYGSFPYPLYRELRDEVKGPAELFAFANIRDSTVLGPDGSSTARALLVSGNYFSAYGAQTLIGRILADEDDRAAAPLAAVVSYGWWERHSGLNPEILGRTITLNQTAFTVVGVLPRQHVSPLFKEPDIYVPLSAQPLLVKGHPLEARNHWWIQIMGRLTPGANEAQMRSALQAIFQRHVAAPDSGARIDQPVIVLQDGSRGMLMQRNRLAAPLFALQAVVTLVLLIVCLNLSGLLLARAAGRRREMAVRAALGASRSRLAAEYLSEGLMLALAGGGLGLIVAAWIKAAILAAVGQFAEGLHVNLSADGRVLAYTFGVSVVAALLFGLVPALRASRAQPGADLGAGRGAAGERQRVGRVLVSVQVGLSLLLVAGAALLLRTVANLEAVDLGFTTDNTLVFRLNAEQAGHKGSDRLAFYERVRERVAAIPGVRAVSLSNNALLGGALTTNGIAIPGRETAPGQSLQADELVVSDSFFTTLGIPIVLGRALSNVDAASSRRTAVVNERFVQQFFDGQSPIGRTFLVGANSYEILGVCADARYNSLRNAVGPTMYLSYSHTPPASMFYEVRSALPPLSLTPAVRRAVAAIDGNAPISRISTQQALLEGTVLPEKLLASLCVAFAAFAMLLSCIGLNGLVAYDVARRTSEFGVRMSLGATPARIAWPVVRDALAMAGWGLAFGLPAALALSLAMRGVLYGVKPLDPASMIGAVIALLLVAALAAWLPARRAAKVDPMVALRCE